MKLRLSRSICPLCCASFPPRAADRRSSASKRPAAFSSATRPHPRGQPIGASRVSNQTNIFPIHSEICLYRFPANLQTACRLFFRSLFPTAENIRASGSSLIRFFGSSAAEKTPKNERSEFLHRPNERSECDKCKQTMEKRSFSIEQYQLMTFPSNRSPAEVMAWSPGRSMVVPERSSRGLTST